MRDDRGRVPAGAPPGNIHVRAERAGLFHLSRRQPIWLACQGKGSLLWYQGIFADSGNAAAVGEASPYYICCHHVAAEIFKFNPDAKIITILRNPVHRALSMYRYWHSASGYRISLEDFVDSFKHEQLGNEFEFSQKIRVGWLKDIGFYFKHLERYSETFPKSQIKILYYQDLTEDFRAFYREVFDFLGVNDISPVFSDNDVVNETLEPRSRWLHGLLNQDRPGMLVPILKKLPLASHLNTVRAQITKLNRKRGNPLLEQLSAEVYRELIGEYLDDITKLEAMTGRDLAGWRNGTMK